MHALYIIMVFLQTFFVVFCLMAAGSAANANEPKYASCFLFIAAMSAGSVALHVMALYNL